MLRTGSLAFEVTVRVFWHPSVTRYRFTRCPMPLITQSKRMTTLPLKVPRRCTMRQYLMASGVRTLDVWYYGDRNLTIKGVEPMKPDDLSGLSVRCMDTPIAKTVVAALGGNPVPINMSELYLSLQTGVVVGEENPVPTIIARSSMKYRMQLC